jgi:hypothetical protein
MKTLKAQRVISVALYAAAETEPSAPFAALQTNALFTPRHLHADRLGNSGTCSAILLCAAALMFASLANDAVKCVGWERN